MLGLISFRHTYIQTSSQLKTCQVITQGKMPTDLHNVSLMLSAVTKKVPPKDSCVYHSMNRMDYLHHRPEKKIQYSTKFSLTEIFGLEDDIKPSDYCSLETLFSSKL